ncbi:MAG: hypothetical protein BGO01_08685 [Armatimonadetes bacterium 55-13]|nr:hypothetical protein [Armatimonadota bacterium]OJU62031.1 MAG: hypothetical protein BGO01_08685 [Armatimonadetes bacterium 55-13]
MEYAEKQADASVSVLDASPNEDVRFLAAIADIVRDLIEEENRPFPFDRMGRDAPPVWAAYRLIPLPPTDLN